MGKTAIARMLGLALVSDGWEAHECTRPEQVHERLDPDKPQIFIADDAFGSTEAVYGGDCAEHAGIHMFEDQCLVEVVDGRLVITSFIRRTQPLIRYELGDLAQLDTSPCACGRSLARIRRRRLRFQKSAKARLRSHTPGPVIRTWVSRHSVS
jgi:phenylacetate-coenzyme A ligase PaaK-like adenylate-forming protein